MTIVFAKVDISQLERALDSLKEAFSVGVCGELERDGTIQRFEYTFELAWKTMRRCLIAMGNAQVSASPRPVLRMAFREGFISDIELWFEFLEARNAASHIYDEGRADLVFEVSKKLPVEVEGLIAELKNSGE